MSVQQDAEPVQPDQAIVIEPGQTLIMRYAQAISNAQADEIRRRITSRMPDVEVIIIGGCDQLVVYQPATEPR